MQLGELASLYDMAMKRHALTESQDSIHPYDKVHRLDSQQRDEHFASGLGEIAEGRVAAILMGGGQGTRLGSAEPKGLFNVGLPSQKSLLHVQAQRLRRLQTMARDKAGACPGIPWYIMTSEATDERTEKFFADNAYFGLDPNDVSFFEQGRYPALLEDGKIAIKSRGHLSMSPNGNGGIYEAVARNKILEDLQKRGIEYVFVYGVDNIAIRICDPAMIGLLKSEKGDCGVKVVPKDYPAEKVGVVALRNDLPSVVEYSELDPHVAQRVDQASGKLVYNTGNICTHLYTVDFLRQSCEAYKTLAKHVAHKIIPYYNLETEQIEKPTKENGFKFEMFVFDVFALSKSFVVMEVRRDEEFLPLKNKDGTADANPTSCREGISNMHKRYLKAAGVELQGNGLVEISPLVSYAGEGLSQVLAGRTIQLPAHITLDSIAKL